MVAADDPIQAALEAFQKAQGQNNIEQSEAAAVTVLGLAAKWIERNPSREFAASERAYECEACGDWAGAESHHREGLALAEAAGNAGLISRGWLRLSRFFQLIGDLGQAQQAARTAADAARPANVAAVKVMAQENLARCLLRSGDRQGALEAASEAVRLVGADPMNDSLRAGALVMRASSHLSFGDVDAAEKELECARRLLLEREISPLFAGSQARAAAWWEATAQVRALRGDFAGAAGAWGSAVEYARHVAALEHVAGPYTLAALAHTLRGWSKALATLGKNEAAEVAETEAARIRVELGIAGQP